MRHWPVQKLRLSLISHASIKFNRVRSQNNMARASDSDTILGRVQGHWRPLRPFFPVGQREWTSGVVWATFLKNWSFLMKPKPFSCIHVKVFETLA